MLELTKVDLFHFVPTVLDDDILLFIILKDDEIFCGAYMNEKYV